jgi:hypothetical protein
VAQGPTTIETDVEAAPIVDRRAGRKISRRSRSGQAQSGESNRTQQKLLHNENAQLISSSDNSITIHRWGAHWRPAVFGLRDSGPFLVREGKYTRLKNGRCHRCRPALSSAVHRFRGKRDDKGTTGDQH